MSVITLIELKRSSLVLLNPKMKIQVVANLFVFLSSAEHKGRYFEERYNQKKYLFSRFVITTFFFCQINLNNLFSSELIILSL